LEGNRVNLVRIETSFDLHQARVGNGLGIATPGLVALSFTLLHFRNLFIGDPELSSAFRALGEGSADSKCQNTTDCYTPSTSQPIA
jgi:hypothetical protein